VVAEARAAVAVPVPADRAVEAAADEAAARIVAKPHARAANLIAESTCVR
jgi:hypothetical protein